jgi:hypothetical protein
MMDKQDGSVPHDVRPRTRSIARVERLVIPSSLDISDSEEEHAGQDRASYFVPKPFGASQSVVQPRRLLERHAVAYFQPQATTRTIRQLGLYEIRDPLLR